MNKQLSLVFVVEADDISRTDEIYIKKYLSIHHALEMQSGLLTVRFVHMGGKTKYKSGKVTTELKDYIQLAKAMKEDIEVIYCFDADRLNKSDIESLNEARQYVTTNGYHYVLINPEIEPLFGITDYKDKVGAARRFQQQKLNKESLDIKKFAVPIEKVYQTRNTSNLEIVLREILKEK